MRQIERALCWVAYQIAVKTPVDRVSWRLYMWLLPHAGSYAYYWSLPAAERAFIDETSVTSR